VETMTNGVNAISDSVSTAEQAADEIQEEVEGGKKGGEGGKDQGIRPFIIPVTALIIGGVMMQVGMVGAVDISMWGKLVLYFGAQSFMNIFMSYVSKSRVILPRDSLIIAHNGTEVVLTKNLTGCPAGFVVTAFQQVISFILFIIYFVAVFYTPYKYMPKRLNSMYEYLSVIIFGMVFALNIALNNFSLGYISIGVNLILRSCLPLSTYVSQQFLAKFDMYAKKPFQALEVLLMTIGVLCAIVFTLADLYGSDKKSHSSGGGESFSKFVGVVACVASVLCGSLNLALAGVLGETKLSVLDTVAYMAIPATLTLIPVILFFSKPVPAGWHEVSSGQTMTDWQILQFTWKYGRETVAVMALSGVLSFAYNIIQITIVHTLSPSATAFGGNFNKAALTFLTLLCPFLQTSAMLGFPYYQIQWLALIVNIYAFSHYSYLQIKDKERAAAKAHQPMADEEVGEDSGDDSSSGSE